MLRIISLRIKYRSVYLKKGGRGILIRNFILSMNIGEARDCKSTRNSKRERERVGGVSAMPGSRTWTGERTWIGEPGFVYKVHEQFQ